MSGLLIRVDACDHVLRSVGEPPHGIVCMGCPDGRAAWVIDAAFDPRGVTGVPGHATVVSEPTPDGVGHASTLVDTDELCAACESVIEARALAVLMNGAVAWAVERAAATFNYEFVTTHIDLAISTRNALSAAGFLARPA